MSIIVRPLDLETLWLYRDTHEAPPFNHDPVVDPEGTGPLRMCLLEAGAYMAGEDWTDSPACVDPVMAMLGRVVNDLLDDEPRQELRWLLPRMLGTANDGLAVARWWLATDWIIREVIPQWLDALDRPGPAAAIRNQLPIEGSYSWSRARSAVLEEAATEHSPALTSEIRGMSASEIMYGSLRHNLADVVCEIADYLGGSPDDISTTNLNFNLWRAVRLASDATSLYRDAVMSITACADPDRDPWERAQAEADERVGSHYMGLEAKLCADTADLLTRVVNLAA